MNRCFVMQPFDRATFDKRYDDVYAPAIKDAGLAPYRVDRDAAVSIPIDEIESGIRDSELCLADITVDNPNVWFELGFAIAVSKEVVLVCSDTRKERFPFDVQHRNIIIYQTESSQDFRELQKKITERMVALLKKQGEIGIVSKISPLQDTEGLSPHELVALVVIEQNTFISGGEATPWRIREDMEKVGYTEIAVSLAIRMLLDKGMILSKSVSDMNGEEYTTYIPTRVGANWLLAHQDKLVLRHTNAPTSVSDDPPF